ncbi:MAG: hypothetical protein FWF57_01755 [Defluviitaleaceae bacterium]|nr:hypothetical protein [Defluviitaleaceae bacterium]
MENKEFEKIKEHFIEVNTDEKIRMYTTIQGLEQNQYKELLRFFPYNEIKKLEDALA